MRNALSSVHVDARVRRLRHFLVFTIAIVLAWLMGCAAIGILAVEGALHLPRLTLTDEDKQHAMAVAKQADSSLMEVEIRGADGAVLRAWSFRPQHQIGDAVILLHGQGRQSCGDAWASSRCCFDTGTRCCLPDARGHGESGGADRYVWSLGGRRCAALV